MQNYLAKCIRIYTSSSISEKENNNSVQTHFTQKKNLNNSFDDKMLLLVLNNNNKRSDIQESSFKKFFQTPNYAQIKTKLRQKALNYVRQRITKDLSKDKTSNNSENFVKLTKNDNNNSKAKARKKSSEV